MAQEIASPSALWDESVNYDEMPRVKTGISFTPRLLSAMLVGGNAMGVNWASKFAKIPEMEVPDNALKPIVKEGFTNNGGENLLSALLPPDIMGDLTETNSVDDVRDGLWIPEVLEVVTGRLIANNGDEIEHMYERCQKLMRDANTTVFYWDANFVVHVLAVDRIDDTVFMKSVNLYRRYAEEDPAGSLFGLFLLSFLGPAHFNDVAKSLS